MSSKYVFVIDWINPPPPPAQPPLILYKQQTLTTVLISGKRCQYRKDAEKERAIENYSSGSRLPLSVAQFKFYKLFWTQTCPQGKDTNGTHRSHARCLPTNPTTRKGWPHRRGLRPLPFSNSSVGFFTSHKNRSVKVL